MKTLSKSSKCCILIILVVGWFTLGSDVSFAQATTSNGDNTLEGLNAILITIAKTLSRVWIPIANFAGKLMTNDFTNGEIFGLSNYLFKCWNIMRIIANILIVGAIMTLIYNTATSDKNTITVGSVIRLIGAGIGINMSWFIIALVVDLSTLGMYGISNVGHSLIKDSPYISRAFQTQLICIPKKQFINYHSNRNDGSSLPPCLVGTNQYNDEYYEVYNGSSIDKLIPTQDSMAGPLVYFGIAVFKFFDYTDVNTLGVGGETNLKSISIGFFVKIFLMMMFLAPLIGLLIINIARIMLIWIWMITGPLIALRVALGEDALGVGRLKNILSYNMSGGDGGWFINGDIFKFSNIIGAIFAPITVLSALFFAILLTSGLYLGLSGGYIGDEKDLKTNSAKVEQAFVENTKGISIDQNKINIGNSSDGKSRGSFELNGDIVKDASQLIGGGIGYLIYTIFVVGILWALFRVGLSTSSLLGGIGKSVMSKSKNILLSNIKLPVGGESVSLNALDKEVVNLDKIKGKLNDIYVKPFANKQKRDAAKDLSRAGVNAPYQGSAKFDTKEKFTDETDYAGAKLNDKFISPTRDYFNKLQEELRNGDKSGTVKGGDSTDFRNNIAGWIKNGGYEFLVKSKIIEKDKYLLKETKDGKEITSGIDTDKLFAEDANVGGFFAEILQKNKSSLLTDGFSNATKLDDIQKKVENYSYPISKPFDKITFGK
ncbi:MAG TPA: hypothetical protein PK048_00775 [Candidatus Absconditabacterales bacterium]|nr:hypothetical protein [Candidatus Absconditabacterales bacterium]